jgi:DNA-binding CsgD family transcriptional regulator
MTTPLPLPEVERGRDAYTRRAWTEAYDALSAADEAEALACDDLERLAWSAALTGRDQDLLRLLERLHGIELEAGRRLRAARCAFWLSFRLYAMGERARASGWAARAQRLIEREGKDCVEQGYLLLPVFRQRLTAGDAEGAHAIAVQAKAIGERFHDADLTAFSTMLLGQARLRLGKTKDGLILLDEAMITITTGELSPLMTGFIYCSAIAACETFYAVERAREWTAALAAWCDAQPDITFNGICMVHRARILQLGGEWLDAIAAARKAAELSTHSVDNDVRAGAAYEQAEIHRLRGEFELAETAYARASELGREPQPGLSLLRLAQGRRDAAASSIRRLVLATSDVLERVSLLPAALEVALAVGELDEARKATDELEQRAAEMDMEVVEAMAAQARGALNLAEGDAQAALIPLRRAFGIWQHAGAPYIAARVRVLLGQACHALGDEDGAALEFAGARQVFEKLEAGPDISALALLDKARSTGTAHGLTARELEVLRLVAQGLTNKAIAKQLFLSEKTVDRHVSNIFTKVNVSTRAAATAYAYQHRLV